MKFNQNELGLYVIEAKAQRRDLDSLSSIINEFRADWQASITQTGGILLRGFCVRDGDDFRQVLTRIFPTQTLSNYRGGLGHKKSYGDGIYSSTEVSARFEISAHHEMAYLPKQPRYIAFFCRKPALSGGRTSIVCGAELYRALDPTIRERFETLGVRYTRTYPTHSLGARWGVKHAMLVNWRTVFGCHHRVDVEAQCEAMGLSTTWLKGDLLQTRVVLPAVQVHPTSEEKIWYNQAHTFVPTRRYLGALLFGAYKLAYTLKSVRQGEAHFGNGDVIPTEAIDHIHATLKNLTSYVDWRPGDLLILDNKRTLHGREAYHGERRLLTAML